MLIADIQRKSGSQREQKKGEKKRERESLRNFLSTVNLKQAYGFSKLSNSICGLAVEKFRQFASLRAFRGFTVNFFRIFPPRDSRGPLHTSNQRHRDLSSHWKMSLLNRLLNVYLFSQRKPAIFREN